MKASYTTLDGHTGNIEAGAIVAQPMQGKDGFTLLCFKDWEAVHDEKLSGAVTELASFQLGEELTKVGFHAKD